MVNVVERNLALWHEGELPPDLGNLLNLGIDNQRESTA